jgi:hypothetical protein
LFYSLSIAINLHLPPSTPYNFGLLFFGLQSWTKWYVAFVEVPVVSYRTLRDFLLVAIQNCIKYDKEAFYLTGLLGYPVRLPLIEPL